MPKLKVDQKANVSVSGERVGSRLSGELMDLVVLGKLDGKTLSEKEAKVLVDTLGREDETAKRFAELVKKGKPVILSYAEAHKMYEIVGNEWLAKAKDSTSFHLSASKTIKILEKEGKLKLLDSVLKVSAEDFRKYLGSDLFEKSASKEEKAFASISLKRIKKVADSKEE